MYQRKLVSLAVTLVLVLSAVWVASATPKVNDKNEQRGVQTIDPLNIAILIQDDLVPQVSNEIGVTRDFIRSLPQGSQVMLLTSLRALCKCGNRSPLTSRRLRDRCAFRLRVQQARRSIRTLKWWKR